MLEVTRNGRVFDVDSVADAVEWAYEKAQREDEMNAAKNCADDVQWSPLVHKLEQAQALLLEMRMWSQVGTQDVSP